MVEGWKTEIQGKLIAFHVIFFKIILFSYCRRGALLKNIFQIWTENTGDQDYALRPGSTLLIPLGLPSYLARMCSSVFLLAAPTWGLKR